MARLSAWMWFGPLAFLVHDTEEVATVGAWLPSHAVRLPEAVRPLVTGVTTGRFALSVAILFVGFALAAWHGATRARRGARSWPFLLVAGAFAANGLTHLGQAAFFRGYTPGAVTAALVVLPYSYGLVRALRAAELVPRRGLAALLALGLFLQVPLAILALAAGGNLRGTAP